VSYRRGSEGIFRTASGTLANSGVIYAGSEGDFACSLFLVLRVLALLPLVFPLTSCGLVKVPFRVAGAVVEGGANVGKAGYQASKKAFSKSDEEKAKEKKEKEEKLKREADEEKAKRAAEINRHSDATKQQQQSQQTPPTSAGDTLPPLPPDNTPLPNDAPLPYQGQ
jgi:hypothetical protein